MGMNDSIAALTAEIREFCDRRDWGQYHGPKEMAVAIAAEAGELLQHFVWQDAAQSDERAVQRGTQIEDELADVATLVLEMAGRQGIDLAAAIRAKLSRNETRYPVEKSRGNNRKYNEL